jgi:hypothetical protein
MLGDDIPYRVPAYVDANMNIPTQADWPKHQSNSAAATE